MSSAPQRKPRLGTIKEQLDVRREREADIAPRVVKRPGPGFGQWTVHDTLSGNEETVSAPMNNQSFAPGAVVLVGSNSGQGGKSIIASAPVGRQGAADFAFPQSTGAQRDSVGIVEADPATLAAGTVEEVVTFTGHGFREDPVDTFRPVRPYDSTTKTYPDDELITLGDVTWVSLTEVTIPVSVSATAPEGYEIRLEVTRS